MSLEIRELNHVAINVRDLDASMRFYEQTLGLKRIPRPAFDFPGAWYALGNQELHLIADPGLASADRRHHHFALRVDDAFAARTELERRGVTQFIGPRPRPDGVMQLYVHDPDGYEIEIFSTNETSSPDKP